MFWNLDTLIFLSFLFINIVLGLTSSRGIKNIKEYAVGDRNFSTATLVATIVATWVSGETFFTNSSESYSNGAYFIWVAVLGNFLYLFATGYLFAPRMGEFLGKLSIAEAMGDLFGKRVRVITAFSGFVGVAGILSIQLKIAGIVFEYALNLPAIYGVLSAGVIVTLYSSLGGVKSVTFTDVIQFFTFGTIIPALLYFLLESIGKSSSVSEYIMSSPLFNLKEVFDFSKLSNITYLFLFFWVVTPDFNPAFFQRVTMGRNVEQVKKSFIISSFTCTILLLMVCAIGVLMMLHAPELPTNGIIRYMINLPVVGIKGLLLIGLMAMIMSTVDSYINSTSVLIVHDFLKPMTNFVKNELLATRIAAGVLGAVATIFCLREGSLLELLVISYSFWMPVVTVPFIMAIFGFRSTEKSVILGMIAGISTVFVWDYVVKITIVNSIPVAMFANLVVLIGSHYLLNQSGGWVGIKDEAPLLAIRAARREIYSRFWKKVCAFNFLSACRKNCPKGDGLIAILGFFTMVSVFTSTHTLERNIQVQYSYFLDFLTPFMFCIISILISYPLWLPKWRDMNLIGIVWNCIMLIDLICCSFLMVLLSNFSELQLLAFFVNIIIISTLINWGWALFNIILGVSITTYLYQHYLATDLANASFVSSQFEIFYILLLISSTIVIFLKPKQEYQELTEEKAEYLGERISDREDELTKSLALKYEFLRNLQHEGHKPLTSVAGIGELLYENYDKFTDKERQEMIGIIAKSSDSLLRFVDNMIDVSKLSSMTYELNKTKVNISELVENRLGHCKKLYLNDKDLVFVTKIEPAVSIDSDKHYIKSTIDNLIINAIQYSKQGTIRITLTKAPKNIRFTIADEGIGIPSHELQDIFGEFVVSTKTKTPSGGRGIGLALCKKSIEAHGGKIWAESDGASGATFVFVF